MSRDVIAHRPWTLLGGLNIGLGAVLVLGEPARTSSFSFAVARDLLPIRAWGAAFMLVGLVVLFALRLGPVGG